MCFDLLEGLLDNNLKKMVITRYHVISSSFDSNFSLVMNLYTYK